MMPSRFTFSTIALTLLLLGASGCSVFHAGTTRAHRETVVRGPYDALIVPGFPSKKGDWNRVIKARVYWAKDLYERGVVRRVIFSGAAVHQPYVEGQLMAIYARAVGLPDEVILTETNALHSCENLYFSYRLARDQGLSKLAVASDPIQTIGLRHYAREFDLPLAFLPVDFVALWKMEKIDPEVDVSIAYVEGFVPLKKRLSRKEIKRNSGGARVRAALEAEPITVNTE